MDVTRQDRVFGLEPRLFFLFFFLFLVEVILFFFLFLDLVFVAFFLFLVVEVIGNGIQMDGVRLRHFELGFALRAAQDFALFHFVLIHVNFGATIGAANHGTILRTKIRGAEPENRDRPTVVLYTAV
jgi:hypothetical protein